MEESMNVTIIKRTATWICKAFEASSDACDKLIRKVHRKPAKRNSYKQLAEDLQNIIADEEENIIILCLEAINKGAYVKDIKAFDLSDRASTPLLPTLVEATRIPYTEDKIMMPIKKVYSECSYLDNCYPRKIKLKRELRETITRTVERIKKRLEIEYNRLEKFGLLRVKTNNGIGLIKGNKDLPDLPFEQPRKMSADKEVITWDDYDTILNDYDYF